MDRSTRTTFTTARPSDDVMPTGVFYRIVPGPDREIVLAENVGIHLDAGVRFEQRFNLLDSVKLFVTLMALCWCSQVQAPARPV